MASKATVSVLIEKADGSIEYRQWQGTSVKRIHARARARYAKEYPGCKVSFGAALWVNSYGAH